MQSELQIVLRRLPQWEREARDRMRELNRVVTMLAVGDLIDELKEKYSDLSNVVEFLAAMQADIVENTDQFLKPQQSPLGQLVGISANHNHLGQRSTLLRRYQVNLLVSQSPSEGAPVVYKNHTSYQNLVGEIGHLAPLGALVTDFDLIKAGALHRANGGYLILDAVKALSQPYAWEGLKRTLKANEVRIESLGQALSLVRTVSLKPQPIPLEVKVILLGERIFYYLFCQFAPEF